MVAGQPKEGGKSTARERTKVVKAKKLTLERRSWAELGSVKWGATNNVWYQGSKRGRRYFIVNTRS